MEELQGHDNGAMRMIRFANKANPADRAISWALADRMYDSLDEAVRHGIDRRAALTQILEIFPDHPRSLRALARLADADGEPEQAAQYRARYREVDPLGAAVGIKYNPSHDRLTP